MHVAFAHGALGVMGQKILSKSQDNEIAAKTRASTGDHLLSLRTVKVVLVFPSAVLGRQLRRPGHSDHATLQLPRPFVRIHNNLILQQGGLICRSIVNDTNAEGRLHLLIYTDLNRAGKRRSSAEFEDRPADAKASL